MKAYKKVIAITAMSFGAVCILAVMPLKRTEAAGQITATSSTATPSNPAGLSQGRIPLKASAMTADVKAVKSQTARWGERFYYNVEVSNYSTGQEMITVRIEDADTGEERSSWQKPASYFAGGRELSLGKWNCGKYRMEVLDEPGQLMGTLDFIIEKAELEIRIDYPVVEKYSSDYIQADKYGAFFYRDTGEAVEEPGLILAKLDREPGEEPGKYKINGMTVHEDFQKNINGTITVAAGSKGSYYLVEPVALVEASGKEIESEAVISRKIQELFPALSEVPSGLMSYKLDLAPEEEDAFRMQPQISGDNLTFALKNGASPDSLMIPFPIIITVANGDSYMPETLELKINISGEAGQDGFRNPIVFTGRSESEIKAYFASHPFNLSKSVTYKEAPSRSDYRAGVLSDETIEDGLNAFNSMRYLAGLQEVVYDDIYGSRSQAGAMLLSIIGGLDHHPKKPAGVPDSFYETAYMGTAYSNLGRGQRNISDSIINGYMEDGDADNIDGVGHRMWCLDPRLEKTGFGYYSNYTATYVVGDGSSSYYPYDEIWPVSVMPYEYFRGPWHIGLWRSGYTADENTLEITMTGKSSGKKCVIDKNAKNVNGKYLGKSVDGSSLIIFQPDVKFSPNEEVEVEMTGLLDELGREVKLHYSVKFFQMNGSSGGNGGSGGGSTGGGGSSGGGSSSGGSGSSGGGGSSAKRVSHEKDNSLPSYVVNGNWNQRADCSWGFTDASGMEYKNRWAAIYNPYADTNAGFQPYDWFRFDENGVMAVGWFTDPADQNVYYLNPASDGTRGRMMTGWVTVDGKEYYFNPDSDGTRGRMLRNERTKDGHFTGDDGVKVR